MIYFSRLIFTLYIVYETNGHRKDGKGEEIKEEDFIDINTVYLPDPLVTFYPPRESTVSPQF